MEVLVIDVGGTRVKLSASGAAETRRFPSGTTLTPENLVDKVKQHTQDWNYDVVALGFPGSVDEKGPTAEPGNLGTGWVGFDFQKELARPVRVVNDAVMQALGAYESGRMLFLGLGTGVGSALSPSTFSYRSSSVRLRMCAVEPSSDTWETRRGRSAGTRHGRPPSRKACQCCVRRSLRTMWCWAAAMPRRLILYRHTPAGEAIATPLGVPVPGQVCFDLVPAAILVSIRSFVAIAITRLVVVVLSTGRRGVGSITVVLSPVCVLRRSTRADYSRVPCEVLLACKVCNVCARPPRCQLPELTPQEQSPGDVRLAPRIDQVGRRSRRANTEYITGAGA